MRFVHRLKSTANLLIEQARSEATRIVAAAREAAEKEAESVVQSARDSLRDEVATLAVKGAEADSAPRG